MPFKVQPPAVTTTNNVTGIFWALIAIALFAIAAAMAKHAVTEYHVLQILLFRQFVVFLSSLPTIAKSFPHSLKTKQPLLHAVRLCGAFIALSSGIWAVSVLPLTTATTLGFSSVFVVALVAAWFLGEHIGKHRIATIFTGFIGVLIIMRPGVDGLLDLYTLIPIFGAIGVAMATTAVRKLSQTESTATLLVYQAVFVGVLAAIPLYWFWVTPDLQGTLLLLAMGVVATFGQWTGIVALRHGEASVIGTIQYTSLFYAALLGYLIFDEIPDRYTVLGAVIIIGSALYLYHRENLHKRAAE